MKAIETTFDGYRFRSRLEARWAVAFKALCLPYEYERQGYVLDEAGPYLPDFWLPTVSSRGGDDGVWVEIKPTDPTLSEEEKCALLSRATGHPVYLFVGVPGAWHERGYRGCGGYEWRNGRYDNYQRIYRCFSSACGHAKCEFDEGHYAVCPRCGACSDDTEPHLLAAFEAARSARFEHGERPVLSR